MHGLASFIELLKDNGLLAFDVLGNDRENFVNRLKIQKYVFIATKCFNLDFGYSYSLYRYGPYSPTLAEDYYELAENPKIFEHDTNDPLPEKFDVNGFMELVSDEDENWLEIASTLLDQVSETSDVNELINRVSDIKVDYSPEYIASVLEDLVNHKLIP
jgi:uncharacterized protein YwgA